MYMFGIVGETHAHDYFEVISFYKNEIMSAQALRCTVN